MTRDEIRYGYHSFPRRDQGTRAGTASKGLAILRSIVTSGLLLRPEIVTVPGEILDDGRVGEASYIGERFAAFTVRTVKSLVGEHADRFGEFAVELEVATLVEIGALPVFYLPLRADQQSPGRSLAARTAEISRLLERLQAFAATAEEPHQLVRFSVSGRPVLEIDRQLLRELLGLLALQSRPFHELAGAFQALASLFYPVDGPAVEELRFFEQREWRVLSNALDSRHFTASPPTQEERETLRGIDRAYYDAVIDFRSGKRPRIDECVFLRRIRGRPFLDYARRVVVPDAVTREAREILAPSFPNLPVVPFNSLGL